MNLGNAFLYGKGFFTTICVADGRPLFWEKHWQRLVDHSKRLGISIAQYSEHELLSQVNDEIEATALIDGRVRITFSDSTPSTIWSEIAEPETSLSIIVGKCRVVPQPFRLTVSPFTVNTRSPLAGLKTCNYLENILAIESARRNGFAEAIRLNETGNVVGGCMSNVFWLQGDVLFTPSITTGCLAGTTREYVLEKIDCHEVAAPVERLSSADAIYVSSAGLGIVKVSEIDGREFNTIDHPIMHLWPPVGAR